MNNSLYQVSVIVPIYNAAATLEKTLYSLLNQTLERLEIICVDDGSTDNSINILNKISVNASKQIRIISTENHGVFAARQTGIAAARGQYIGFCDSDDEVSPTMYEKMYLKAIASNAEIVTVAYHRISSSSGKILSTEMQKFNCEIRNVTCNSGWLVSVNTSLWNKLFRSDILTHHITFSTPPRVMEDAMFLLSLYPYITKIAFLSEPLYNYYVTAGSAMSYIHPKELNIIINDWQQTRLAMQSVDPNYAKICDLAVFIHLGISASLRLLSNIKNINLHTEFKNICHTLDQYFPLYKNNPFLSFSYVWKYRKTLRNVKIAYLLFRSKLFLPALYFYHFITTKFKFDIKW